MRKDDYPDDGVAKVLKAARAPIMDEPMSAKDMMRVISTQSGSVWEVIASGQLGPIEWADPDTPAADWVFGRRRR